MSARSTSGERTDGGPPPGNAGKSQALVEFLLVGRMRLVTMFVAAEAVLMAVSLVFEFVLGLTVLAALFAAAAFVFVIVVVGSLGIWLVVRAVRRVYPW